MNSARTLTLVALVLYGLFGGLFLLLGLVLLPFGLFFIVLGALPLIFLFIVYATVYQPLGEGRVSAASAPALVLGILSLLFGGVISGILLLVAYAKIESASRALVATPPSPGYAPPSPGPTAPPPGGEEPQGAPYCPSCGAQVQPPYRFCNNCGTRLA